MVKVYKSRDGKELIVYLPFEVVKKLGIENGDEVDFLKFNDKAFIFAKKADIINIATGKMPMGRQENVAAKGGSLTFAEIGVLKKLDTLRYPVRNIANVSKILNDTEEKILAQLLKKKIVSLYTDEKRKEELYSIPKNIYNSFLLRKKTEEANTVKAAEPVKITQSAVLPNIENDNITKLEKDGYVVIATEAEASAVSIALEASIRQGKVIGIRAFNKKYYIMLRSMFDRNSAKLLKELRDGPKPISELVKRTGLEEDALRTMLYVMLEQGDVSENRKDTFALV